MHWVNPELPLPIASLLEVVWGLCLLFWCVRDNKRSPEGEVGLLASVSTREAMTDFHGRLLVPDTERAAPARCSP